MPFFVIEVVCMVLSLWYKATILNSKHSPRTNFRYHPCRWSFLLFVWTSMHLSSWEEKLFSTEPSLQWMLLFFSSSLLLFISCTFTRSDVASFKQNTKSRDKKVFTVKWPFLCKCVMLQMGARSQSSYVFTLLQKLASHSQPRLSSITFQEWAMLNLAVLTLSWAQPG